MLVDEDGFGEGLSTSSMGSDVGVGAWELDYREDINRYAMLRESNG